MVKYVDVAILVFLLPATTFAFSGTVPVVAWSSQESSHLDVLPTASSSLDNVPLLDRIFSDDICSYDAVIIVDQPGLHGFDLRLLAPSSYLARTLKSAPSSRQYPYVRRASNRSSFDIAESVADRCQSRLVYHDVAQGGASLETNAKHVVCMTLPPLDGSAKSKKISMVKHESLISTELENIKTISPNYLVVFFGSFPTLSGREEPIALEIASAPVLSLGNSTLPAGGILKRYQLLTPALITCLFVTFFIAVPMVMMGISALASIQTSSRMDAPKGFNAQEKKNQ